MKAVTINLDGFEERMLAMLAAKYGSRPDEFSRVIRRAFINECVRYGFDLKALSHVLDEAGAK